jgi:hypothetical protein
MAALSAAIFSPLIYTFSAVTSTADVERSGTSKGEVYKPKTQILMSLYYEAARRDAGGLKS